MLATHLTPHCYAILGGMLGQCEFVLNSRHKNTAVEIAIHAQVSLYRHVLALGLGNYSGLTQA